MPDAETTLVLMTSTESAAGGLLAYDDTSSPVGGQIVVMPFNLTALSDSLVARDLLETPRPGCRPMKAIPPLRSRARW